MKVSVVALVLSCISSAIGDTDEVPICTMAAEACVKETGIDPAAWKNVEDGKLDDPKMPDFLFCVFRKLELLNDKAEYQLDVIKEAITAMSTEEIAEKYVKECTKETYEDGPQTALHMTECYQKTVPKKVPKSA